MNKRKIKFGEIAEVILEKNYSFPKYSTQILNLANQNAGGTRPKVVGQMSELIKEFEGNSVADWEKWYFEKNPHALNDAVDKVYSMLENLKEVIKIIDKDMVKNYITDLLINKTYMGLKFQDAILEIVAKEKELEFKYATVQDEAKGIDGFIGGRPVSVKPFTYKQKMNLRENIDANLIFYDKKKDGITIQYDF